MERQIVSLATLLHLSNRQFSRQRSFHIVATMNELSTEACAIYSQGARTECLKGNWTVQLILSGAERHKHDTTLLSNAL